MNEIQKFSVLFNQQSHRSCQSHERKEKRVSVFGQPPTPLLNMHFMNGSYFGPWCLITTNPKHDNLFLLINVSVVLCENSVNSVNSVFSFFNRREHPSTPLRVTTTTTTMTTNLINGLSKIFKHSDIQKL